MNIQPITPEQVTMFNECFSLDKENGHLIWKKKISSKVIVGSRAGYVRADGYENVQVYGKRFLVHRVVYAMLNGECVGEIDHINGHPSDNRPENLRVVTRSQQNMNKVPSRKNSLDLRGVYLHKQSGLFNARIRFNKTCKSLGYYKTPEEAHNAYRKAVKQYHGEYGRAA